MTIVAASRGHSSPAPVATGVQLTHLQRPEGESIHIMREVVAECERPVMLYSIGKDSSVMLHLSERVEMGISPFRHGSALVPLYFTRERPVVERDGTLIMVDDDRMPLEPGETPALRNVRFRTLGCYPLTGAIESEADTLPAIIQEMLLTRQSERQGRVIDHDQSASMEKKKVEGYF